MLTILFKNLLGYDLIIFIIAIVNAVFFLKILKGIKAIDSHFVKTSYLQNDWLFNHMHTLEDKKIKDDLKLALNHFTKEKHHIDQMSTFYISFTNIFPLLGILGTVISLLTLGDFNTEIAAINFSKALSSTFWGILFGVMSKFGEGFFTSKLELYDKLYHEVRTNIIKGGE